MKKLYVASGIVLIIFAIFIAISTPNLFGNTVGKVITENKEVRYMPMEGTEDFVFESYQWTFVGTGYWTLPMNQVEYGSLWTSDNDTWVIITMHGQIIASGITQFTPLRVI
jgi:hypothetical protein